MGAYCITSPFSSCKYQTLSISLWRQDFVAYDHEMLPATSFCPGATGYCVEPQLWSPGLGDIRVHIVECLVPISTRRLYLDKSEIALSWLPQETVQRYSDV